MQIQVLKKEDDIKEFVPNIKILDKIIFNLDVDFKYILYNI